MEPFTFEHFLRAVEELGQLKYQSFVDMERGCAEFLRSERTDAEMWAFWKGLTVHPPVTAKEGFVYSAKCRWGFVRHRAALSRAKEVAYWSRIKKKEIEDGLGICGRSKGGLRGKQGKRRELAEMVK